jgi:hypothetical protein
MVHHLAAFRRTCGNVFVRIDLAIVRGLAKLRGQEVGAITNAVW